MANEIPENQTEEDMMAELLGSAPLCRFIDALEEVATNALSIKGMPIQHRNKLEEARKELRPVYERLMIVASTQPFNNQRQFYFDIFAVGQYVGEILQRGTWPEGHDSIAAIRNGRHANLGWQKADAPRLDSVREIIAEVDARLPKLSIKTRNKEINMRLVEMVHPSTKEKMTPLGEKTLRNHRKKMRNA